MERRPPLLTLAQYLMLLSVGLVTRAAAMTGFAWGGTVAAEIMAGLFASLMAGAAAKRAKLAAWTEAFLDLACLVTSCAIGAVVTLSWAFMAYQGGTQLACVSENAGRMACAGINAHADWAGAAGLAEWSIALDVAALVLAVREVPALAACAAHSRRAGRSRTNDAGRPPVA